MLGTRVLVETHFCGAMLDTTRWYPDYEATVVAETAERIAVRRHWWSRKEWLPKAEYRARKRAEGQNARPG